MVGIQQHARRATAAFALLASSSRAYFAAPSAFSEARRHHQRPQQQPQRQLLLTVRGGGASSFSSSPSALRGAANPAPVPKLGFGKLEFTPTAEVEFLFGDASAGVEWSGDLVVAVVNAAEEADEDGKKKVEDDSDNFAKLSGAAVDVDSKLGGSLSELIRTEEFKGGAKSSVSSMLAGKDVPVKRIGIVGLGKKKNVGDLGKTLAALAKSSKCETMGVILPPDLGAGQKDLELMAENLLTELYEDKRYKDKSDSSAAKKKAGGLKLKKVQLMGQAAAGGNLLSEKNYEKMAEAVNLCKDLVNSPPNFVTPATMAETAQGIAKECGMECTILEEPEIVELGMGAYMGVAQGAVQPPKFIHLVYRPSGEIKKKVAIVGKGLTFDSGGYNLKAGGGSMIEKMKFDMGGAGATLGAAKAIGSMAPPGVEAHFIIAACENMISDKAMRPGDVLTASNGKTIEVINTDAEGRLTLADALVYAENQGVDVCIDCATLTGACIVGLGAQYAALYASETDLSKEIEDAASAQGELIWTMPLASEYEENIKSKIADLKNVGGPYGGSITAALFLKHFVKKMKWAHIDLAGPVWSHEKSAATGYGVRLLTEWIQRQGK